MRYRLNTAPRHTLERPPHLARLKQANSPHRARPSSKMALARAMFGQLRTMRGAEDNDGVEPLRIGIIGATPLAIGLLQAAFSSKKVNVMAAAERDRDLLEAACEPEELERIKFYETYNAMLQDPREDRCDAVFIGGCAATRHQWCVSAAQCHKHVLVSIPAAAEYESSKEMRDVCQAEDVALADVCPFTHHARTEEILMQINEKRFFGDVRRVEATFTISATREFLEGAGREATAKDDPLGCLGDLGWACARIGKLVYGPELQPRSAQVIHSEATAQNVPVDVTAVIYFGEGNSKPLHIHCSYVHPLQQHISIVGDNKILRCDDFAYPRFGKDVSYTVESFPAGDEGRAALVDLGQCVVSAVNRARVFNAPSQRVTMLESFADLCLLENDDEWMRQGYVNKHQARAAHAGLIVSTQGVVQALVQSLRHPGTPIQVPDDSQAEAMASSRMRFD